MNVTVMPRRAYYRTIEQERESIKMHDVGVDGVCTCGGTRNDPCIHIKAVILHLKNGGMRAIRVEPRTMKHSAPEKCPICGGKVVALFPYRCCEVWECRASKAHFWEWKGNGKVRGFLTRPHPNKPGPFYTRSWEDKLRLGRQVDKEMEEYFGQQAETI